MCWSGLDLGPGLMLLLGSCYFGSSAAVCLFRLLTDRNFYSVLMIHRYILSRHGIHPSDYAQTDRPVRIGDVLILPVHAFQADASEGTQKDMFCVWHGFYGSWRSD